MRLHDTTAVSTRDIGDNRLGADGNDDGVRFFCRNECGCHRRVGSDLRAQVTDVFCRHVRRPLEIAFPGRGTGQHKLSAQSVSGFAEDWMMSALV